MLEQRVFMKQEIRTKMLQHMYNYLEEKGVNKRQILEGQTITAADLSQDDKWVDKLTLDKLMTRAAQLVPVPDFFYQLGVYSVLEETKGFRGKILRLTETPALVYHEVAILSFLYTKVYLFNVLRTEKRSAEIEVGPVAPHRISFDNCQYIKGLLAAVPQIFHYGLANIEETHCAAPESSLKPEQINPKTRYGSSKCHYHLSWPGKNN